MVENANKKPAKVLVGSPAHLELEGRIKKDELSYLIMNLPFECDYVCLKCYRRKNVSIEDLDLGLRKKIISQAKDLGAEVVTIPGEGEPLVHKDLVKELIRYNNSLGLITILYTNGSLLGKETAQFMYDNNVTLVASIDSFDLKTYRELTGRGDISRVKENLEKTRDIYREGVMKRSDGTIETRLGMITIITQQNRDEIPDLRNWCGDEMYFICNFPIKEGNAIENWDKLVGTDLERLKEISHQYTETGYGGLSVPLSDGRCIAIYNGITIDTNGDVLVCPASVKSKIGNIKDENLENLWRKLRYYVNEEGNPLCIARDIKDRIFRYHDGIVVQHL